MFLSITSYMYIPTYVCIYIQLHVHMLNLNLIKLNLKFNIVFDLAIFLQWIILKFAPLREVLLGALPRLVRSTTKPDMSGSKRTLELCVAKPNLLFFKRQSFLRSEVQPYNSLSTPSPRKVEMIYNCGKAKKLSM
jgi:hypothetical protein